MFSNSLLTCSADLILQKLSKSIVLPASMGLGALGFRVQGLGLNGPYNNNVQPRHPPPFCESVLGWLVSHRCNVCFWVIIVCKPYPQKAQIFHACNKPQTRHYGRL